MNRLSAIGCAIILAATACLFAPSARADFDALRRAYQSKDYATAWREALQIQSDPRATFILGMMAEKGQGTPVDLFSAAEFYKKSARAGFPLSAIQLGRLYDRGDGVPRDGSFAQELYGSIALGGIGSSDNNVSAHRVILTARNNIAYLWARQNGLLNEALCLSAETIADQPKNAAFLDTYGFILMRLGRLDEAENYLQKAMREKQSTGNLEHLGDLAALRGDTGTAQDWWQRALKIADHPRDVARLRLKIAGGPPDYDSFPPFELKNGGLGENCGPSV